MCVEITKILNPKVDIPLFATNANPLQLYHSPRENICAFNLLFCQLSTTNERFLHYMAHFCGSCRTASWSTASQFVVLEGDANYYFATRIKPLNGELIGTKVIIRANFEDGKFCHPLTMIYRKKK